jgi:hypothetical protein
MPRIEYIEKNFTTGTMAVIDQANAIIAEYTAQGFNLTLRQIYYQFVARDLIENTMRSYKRLGNIINDGRLTGLIDWQAIEDRTRNLEVSPHWDDPGDIIARCSKYFQIDKWADQEYRPEVWIEKEALAGVIEDVCEELDIPYFSCRGYVSQSEMWVAAMRLKDHCVNGQTPIILHFGDHDPSGIDMTRDILDRIELFMGGVKVKRLALNMNQVDKYKPPPNPAKVTDSRYESYSQKYGDDSWELDALEPKILISLIKGAVKKIRDEEQWRQMVQKEVNYITELEGIAEAYSNGELN